jgi:thioredoxin reductase (NADPH)
MKEINAADFEQVISNNKHVVVDFYSTECPPCEALAPKFDNMAELYGNDIQFYKIYRQGNRELAEKLGVKSSPTLLFFNQGKEAGQRLSGGIKKSEIIEQLDTMLPAERVTEIKKIIKPSISEYDVMILGAGPAGLTAGLYLCQAKINTVLIDPQLPGGYVATTHQVSNYPGFIEPQAGYMLSHQMTEQTKQCGTTFKVAVDVTKIDLHKKEVIIDEFETIKAKKIIIATGTRPNPLNIPGEKEFKGKGISYCATCDAKYFVDKEVVVIGGGNSAIEEADFITKFASKLTIIHQFDVFQANKQAQEKLLANSKVNVYYSHEPRKFEKVNDKMLVTMENLKTKELATIEADGVFVFIGFQPVTEMFQEKFETDQWGYILTNEDKQTNIPDVYAVGDITSKKYRQITTAVADGTIAAIAITREFL